MLIFCKTTRRIPFKRHTRQPSSFNRRNSTLTTWPEVGGDETAVTSSMTSIELSSCKTSISDFQRLLKCSRPSSCRITHLHHLHARKLGNGEIAIEWELLTFSYPFPKVTDYMRKNCNLIRFVYFFVLYNIYFVMGL